MLTAVVNTAIAIPMRFTDGGGEGVEGLTVAASARKAGTTTTVCGAVTERNDGEYDAAITLTSTGVWLFQGATTIDGDPVTWTETIEVVTAAQADPAAALAAQNLTVDAPLTTEADKEINAGDAETLQWSSTGWPSLSGQTATFQAYKLTTDAAVFASAKSVTITNAGQATQNLSLTLSGTDTDDFAPGVPYRYEIDSTAGALVSGKLSARSG